MSRYKNIVLLTSFLVVIAVAWSASTNENRFARTKLAKIDNFINSKDVLLKLFPNFASLTFEEFQCHYARKKVPFAFFPAPANMKGTANGWIKLSRADLERIKSDPNAEIIAVERFPEMLRNMLPAGTIATNWRLNEKFGQNPYMWHGVTAILMDGTDKLYFYSQSEDHPIPDWKPKYLSELKNPKGK